MYVFLLWSLFFCVILCDRFNDLNDDSEDEDEDDGSDDNGNSSFNQYAIDLLPKVVANNLTAQQLH